MTPRHESRWFFIGVLVLTLLLVGVVLWPYLGEVAVGVVTAILFRPLYDRALGWSWTRGSAAIATTVTLAAIALVVLVPAGLALSLLAGQSEQLAADLQAQAADTPNPPLSEFAIAPAWLQSLFAEVDVSQLSERLLAGVAQVVAWLAERLLAIVGSIPALIIRFWVFLATLLYVLPNYRTLIAVIQRSMPLRPGTSQRFLDMLTIGLRATILSILVIASVQGLATGGILWLMGVPYVAVWTLLCVIAAIFPLGVLIVTVPISLGMLLVGWVWQPVVLLLWTFVVVPNLDELVRPLIISRSTELHWALVMISAFGGAALFGVWGVVIGPVTMIMARTAIEIYLEEEVTVGEPR